MEDKIIKLMRKVFNTQDISHLTTQSNCDKWDSLRHLNLIVELEEEFDVEFEPEEIAEMKSFDKIKQILETKS